MNTTDLLLMLLVTPVVCLLLPVNSKDFIDWKSLESLLGCYRQLHQNKVNYLNTLTLSNPPTLLHVPTLPALPHTLPLSFLSIGAQSEGEAQAEETPEHPQEPTHPQRECSTHCQAQST